MADSVSELSFGSGSSVVPFHQLPHETTQAVNLIDQIEHDGDGFVVHTKIMAQIADQSCARQIDLREIPTRAVSARPQPASVKQMVAMRKELKPLFETFIFIFKSSFELRLILLLIFIRPESYLF